MALLNFIHYSSASILLQDARKLKHLACIMFQLASTCEAVAAASLHPQEIWCLVSDDRSLKGKERNERMHQKSERKI